MLNVSTLPLLAVAFGNIPAEHLGLKLLNAPSGLQSWLSPCARTSHGSASLRLFPMKPPLALSMHAHRGVGITGSMLDARRSATR